MGLYYTETFLTGTLTHDNHVIDMAFRSLRPTTLGLILAKEATTLGSYLLHDFFALINIQNFVATHKCGGSSSTAHGSRTHPVAMLVEHWRGLPRLQILDMKNVANIAIATFIGAPCCFDNCLAFNRHFAVHSLAGNFELSFHRLCESITI